MDRREFLVATGISMFFMVIGDSAQAINKEGLAKELAHELGDKIKPVLGHLATPGEESFFGQMNDKRTRETVARRVDRCVVDNFDDRLRDWRVICDHTNNTPDIIDGNGLALTLVFQPIGGFSKYKIDFMVGARKPAMA